MMKLSERTSLRCRSCNGHTIFIGKGGHLTCSYIDCAEPSIEKQFAQLEADLAEAINIIVGMQMYSLADVGGYDEEALRFTNRLLTGENE